jgi:hypothetical protein
MDGLDLLREELTSVLSPLLDGAPPAGWLDLLAGVFSGIVL